MKKINKFNEVVIYQSKNGAIELRGDFKHENIWATQKQIAEIFGIDRTVATKHINKIFSDKELDRKKVCAKFAHTTEHGAIKGKTQTREMEFYALDVILSVGYRTNSLKAIEFRKWANKMLKQYLIQGYAINRNIIGKNYNAFMKAVEDIQQLLPRHITLDPEMISELIKEFADTWVSLEAYDKEDLKTIGVTKKSVKLTGVGLVDAIKNLRTELNRKKEATDLFAQERKFGSIEGIVGNVMQSFNGKSLYPTIEEKAAHLLYFMVKNHPFVDGNKRSGAFAFVWFLRKVNAKGGKNINPATLTVLTLLIAESDPKKKEQMVALVTQLLK